MLLTIRSCAACDHQLMFLASQQQGTGLQDPTETLVMSRTSTLGEHEAPTLSDIILLFRCVSLQPSANNLHCWKVSWKIAQGSSETSISNTMANFVDRQGCPFLGVRNPRREHFPKLQARQGWSMQKHFHADPNRDTCLGRRATTCSSRSSWSYGSRAAQPRPCVCSNLSEMGVRLRAPRPSHS